MFGCHDFLSKAMLCSVSGADSAPLEYHSKRFKSFVYADFRRLGDWSGQKVRRAKIDYGKLESRPDVVAAVAGFVVQ